MSDVDKLILEQLVPFREAVVDAIKTKHPYVVGMMESMLSGKQNSVGFQVTENSKVVGEYTFYLDGIRIKKTEVGRLDAEVHHPLLGVIKPCAIAERSAIERAIKDPEFMSEPFSAASKLLPDIKLIFLR